MGTRPPGLHRGLDKVKFPILTIGPQHGCLFWYLEGFDDLYDSHRILKQPFFQVICLFFHLFSFTIRCWTFDVRCSFVCFFIFSHSPFDVGRSMFDVHFFQSYLGKNNLALMPPCPRPLGGADHCDGRWIEKDLQVRFCFHVLFLLLTNPLPVSVHGGKGFYGPFRGLKHRQ